MAELLNLSAPLGFCLFCYKSVEPSVKNTEAIKKFVNSLTRFIETHEANSLLLQSAALKELYSIKNLVKCCTSCRKIMTNFCEKYNQLKLLEFDLDWKLDKLVDRINHANKIPARWKHVSLVLEDKFLNNAKKQKESGNAIRKVRNNFLNAGRQRKKLRQPRVILERKGEKKKTADQPNISKSTGSEYNAQNFVYASYTETKFDWKKFKQVYKDLKCTECNKQLTTFKGLRMHLQTHKDESEWEYECPQCEKKFTCQVNLTRHVRTHTQERPYECQFCGVEFRYRESFKTHLKAYHEDEEGVRKELKRRGGGNFKRRNKFALKQMGKRSDDEEEEKGEEEEEKSESEEGEEDEVDVGEVDKAEDLVEMVRFPDSDDENGEEKEGCGKKGGGLNERMGEIDVDENTAFKDPLIQVKVEPITADHSDHPSKNSSKSKKNTTGPNGSKDSRQKQIPVKVNKPKKEDETIKEFLRISSGHCFTCKFCQKRFRRLTQLNKHLYIDTCPNYYSDDDDKGLVVKSKGKKRKKALMCQKCGKQLKTKLGLGLHMKLHKRKISEHKCRGCGYEFTTSGSLRAHLPKCKGQMTTKIFKCLYCRCKYTTIGYLRKHMKKLHWAGEKFEEELVGQEQPVELKNLCEENDNNKCSEDNYDPLGEIEVKVEIEEESEEDQQVVEPKKRYSLREKRITSFVNINGFNSDEDENEDLEYMEENTTTVNVNDSTNTIGIKKGKKNELGSLMECSLLENDDDWDNDQEIHQNTNLAESNQENMVINEKLSEETDKGLDDLLVVVENENTFGRKIDSFGNASFVNLEDLD